jgi:glycosyltransferase involved in cell wall biosynthesis
MLDILFGPGRRRLIRYVEGLHPDIVHFHETHGLGIAHLRLPSVFTIHGFDHANIPAEAARIAWLRAPLWRRIEKHCLRRHSHIISITPYVREMIRPLTAAAIYDVANPIGAACFEVPRREVPGRILFAGWVSERKNPIAIVRALGRIAVTCPHAHLLVAGEAQDVQYLARFGEAIKEHALQQRVVLLGRLSPDDLRKELSEASVLVLPSFQENAPMAIAEAMAAGLPVISSDRCGMRYMVEEGRTGFLVEPQDDSALASRLEQLLRDTRLRQGMGVAARAAAESTYKPSAVVERILGVYDQVIRSYHRSPAA